MHVYMWLAHLDIRIDQSTPFFNKRLKKFSGEGAIPTAYPLGASWPPNEMSGFATGIAEGLFTMLSGVEVPEKVLSDQETQFMSVLFHHYSASSILLSM